ncbi:MAG TPA: RsmE family RNA methyltransferase [Terriglobales bacterium]|nr:RsmE family RNA methyltransferase [Terriglobales bacterium]
MTRRRWIADEVSGDRAALTGAHAVHLVRVLRAQVGQEFDIGSGAEVRSGRITSITDKRVEFVLGEVVPALSLPEVTLLLAIFKFDRMEWAIEKCTELGVARIVPVIAQRTDRHLSVAAAKRLERWRRIAREAAEQSRRLAPPEIAPPMKLKNALSAAGDLRIVLAETEQVTMLKEALRQKPQASVTVLAVGPEGGWTQDELHLFASAGWILASLGSTILRAETAAIASMAIVIAERDEVSSG